MYGICFEPSSTDSWNEIPQETRLSKFVDVQKRIALGMPNMSLIFFGTSFY